MSSITVFQILQNISQFFFFFFFQKFLSQGNFLHCPKLFILTKHVHTAHTLTEMKQNLLH